MPNQNFDSIIAIKGADILYFKDSLNVLNIGLNKNVNKSVYLTIKKNMANTRGVKLNTSFSKNIYKVLKQPAIRIKDSTFIISKLPDNFHYDFEAIKLKAIDVQIFKIFDNNILQFLQTNDIQGINQIDRVGTIVYENSVDLTKSIQYNSDKWVDYQLNINDFIPEENCIYSVLISFRKEQAVLDENNYKPEKRKNWSTFLNPYYSTKTEDSMSTPYSGSFYGFRKGIHHNLYYTNLGILTQNTNNDTIHIWLTDIQNKKVVKNANIEVLNYQQQVIAKTKSDNNGMASVKLSETPSFIIAKFNNNTTFLKLKSPLKNKNKRLEKNPNFQGYFIKNIDYLKPGDTLMIGFINNLFNTKTDNSTIAFNLYSPDKKKVYSEIKLTKKNNSYLFKYFIPYQAITGSYTAEIIINNKKFIKNYKILSLDNKQLKPTITFLNESKDYFEYELHIQNNSYNINSLAYIAKIISTYKSPHINNYSKYSFGSNASAKYINTTITGYLNENGKDIIRIEKNSSAKHIQIKHEINIQFGTNNNYNKLNYENIAPINKSIIGISINSTIPNKELFYCDSSLQFKIIYLDKDLNPIKRKTTFDLAIYNSTDNALTTPLKHTKLTTVNGVVNWNTELQYPLKGKFKVRAQANNDFFATEREFELSWHKSLISELNTIVGTTINTSKKYYLLGDSIELIINSPTNDLTLLTIDNYLGLLYKTWIKTPKGDSFHKFKVSSNMYPSINVNAYSFNKNKKSSIASCHLRISKPDSLLTPIIFSAHEIDAENTLTINITEKNKLPINYLISVFSNNSINDFCNTSISQFFESSYYSKKIINDIFDNYIFNELEARKMKDDSCSNTHHLNSPFVPFEYQMGPYELIQGEANTHQIRIPQYIGNVTIKVVASNTEKQIFGEASHTLKVNKPLMILANTPDYISPNEIFNIPVNIFSSRLEKREASIELEDINELTILDDLSKIVSVNYINTDTTEFTIKAKQRTGKGTFNIFANDSSFSTTKTFIIPITSNVVSQKKHIVQVIESQSTWRTRFAPLGIKGTNKAAIEYSTIGHLHLNELINQLLNNPHPDIEHIISSAYPLLFIDKLTYLDNEILNSIKKHIQQTINQLIYYQLEPGGFSYRKNNNIENKWCSTYAGHFMMEAQKNGFQINLAVFNKWLRYQRRTCLLWNNSYTNSDLEQAYGLYALVLAKKPDMHSMDKFSNKQISTIASMQLSIAYAELNNLNKAKKLQKLPTKKYNYIDDPTFGNQLRNNSILLESYSITNNLTNTDSILQLNLKLLEKSNINSLQSIAFSLIAIAKVLDKQKISEPKFLSYTLNQGKEQQHESTKPFGIVDIPISFTLSKLVDITNKSNFPLYVSIDYSGRPKPQEYRSENIGLATKLSYYNLKGNIISSKQLNLNQSIYAQITIKKLLLVTSLKHAVLSFPIPSCFKTTSSKELNKNINFSFQKGNTLYYYFDLNSDEITITIPLKANYRGEFHQSPIQVYELYNPSIQSTIIGTDYIIN